MADGQEQEPILWCNRAEPTRTRFAYGWDDNGNRVQLFDDKTGAPRIEKIPQQPHLGTPLFGLQQLRVRRSVKTLCDDGNEREIMVTNAAAHLNDTDNSYERYQLGTKGRKLGWIATGQCPSAMVMMGQISPDTVKSPKARDNEPCSAAVVGYGKPPCRHYKAEMARRRELRVLDDARRTEALKSEEAKLMESNAASQKEATAAMTALSDKLVSAVATIAEKVADAPVAPSKGGK